VSVNLTFATWIATAITPTLSIPTIFTDTTQTQNLAIMKALQHLTVLFFLSLLGIQLSAQNSQTVKGTVLDKQSEQALLGVTIELLNITPAKGAVTDLDGKFVLEEVPLGRQAFRISYLGYNSITVPNVLVSAGKEVVLDLSLEEAVVKMDEVVISAAVNKDKANNDMASVSARSFNVEEVNRFSGGRNDVARLAGSFAGVAAANDSRNDIVIRGNSPTGLLWRLEGIPIPNPNHFSTLGTTGGPVSAINPNLLRSSDFFTSAFPAEYGNAMSGVFDLGFRSGNTDKAEYTFQLAAFSGLEAMAEGPLSKKHNSSYVVSVRNSFVQLADVVGIPVGTAAIPNYRDVSFKFDFANSKLGKFSIFGIGASSNIDFLGKDLDEDDLFAESDKDSYVKSRLGILGLRHNIVLGKNAYVRTVASWSTSGNLYNEYELPSAENPERRHITDVNDRTDTWSLSSYYNQKFNARFTLRAGILGQVYDVDTRVLDREDTPNWNTIRDFDGNIGLWQAFAQGLYKLSEKLTLNLGLHSQVLAINNTSAIEPRAALSWQLAPSRTLTLGYGLHNQMQPLPVFFFREEVSPGVFEPSNQELDFTRANHFVLAYDQKIGTDWRVKAETYFQTLDKVPVEMESSSFSLLNAGADFVFPEASFLVNEGTGRNYGVEITVEKFFSKGYYTLVTGSLFDSKYKGSDGIERNTAFNNGYILNVLAGKEFRFGKGGKNAFTFDTKFTTAGGRNFTPINLEVSRVVGEEVLYEDRAFSERYEPYLRWDVKFGYRVNSKKKNLSQQFFMDFQNVTGKQNIFSRRFNTRTNDINDVYQSGFFPDIMYRVQF